jgi:peptide/nickel transport system substrate-binding protein
VAISKPTPQIVETNSLFLYSSSASLRYLFVLLLSPLLLSCSRPTHNPSALIFVIESNPANLDPRYSSDAQSQRIDRLLFDGLVERDAQMNLHGDLAESWDTPDPLTYIFHLRNGVHFHDARPVTSRDVQSTFAFMMNPANKSPKAGAFKMIRSIETPDDHTVIFHLNEPAASFLWNLERSAVGIVPSDSGIDFNRKLIGSGPFRFVSQSQDDSVVLEQNPNYFRGVPKFQAVTFRIVPDAIVRALELRKGSADVEVSSLSPDMIPVLAKRPELSITERPGTNFAYIGTNLEDLILSKREVRQALAYATDRESLIKYLVRDEARLATGLLPPNHWAYEPNVKTYAYDPDTAEKLLDSAGFARAANGKRFHLTIKVSTDEQARLIGAALQDQWKKIGVDLEVRSLELATLFADLTKGNFQLSYLKWVGANNDPDVFALVFSTKRIPPNGSNRGRYRNSKVDELTDAIRVEMNQPKRKELTSEVQKIVAEDLPYIPLWYADVVSVHRRTLGELTLSPTGDYEFLAAH